MWQQKDWSTENLRTFSFREKKFLFWRNFLEALVWFSLWITLKDLIIVSLSQSTSEVTLCNLLLKLQILTKCVILYSGGELFQKISSRDYNLAESIVRILIKQVTIRIILSSLHMYFFKAVFALQFLDIKKVIHLGILCSISIIFIHLFRSQTKQHHIC